MPAKRKLRRPIVLLIDDEPDDVQARALDLRAHVQVIIREPSEVSVKDLRSASVVLTDYRIEHWPERDKVPSIALRPVNGLALTAVLRAYTYEKISKSPRAFTIHSGKLNDLAGGLSAGSREHAIARAHNLEWVFPKQGSGYAVPLADQVASLAAAIALLPRSWPTAERADMRVAGLLGVPKEFWAERARSDIESCHPPSHESARATGGLVFLRWLLHQVLPFPCFLWDVHYLAARLRVTPQSLEAVLDQDAKTRRALSAAEYAGILCGFLGTRWWRVGIESLLWEWTGGNPFDREALHKATRLQLSKQLEPAPQVQPVVCVDSQFRPTSTLIDISEAVEIQPDDWPAYAEQAWVRREAAADDPALAALVVMQDRRRIRQPHLST